MLAAVFPTMVADLPCLVPLPARITALEQWNRDTRFLVCYQALVERQSARHILARDGCGVREIGRWRPAHGSAPSGRHSRTIRRIRKTRDSGVRA